MRITSAPGQVIETFPEEYSRTGREDENLQLLIRSSCKSCFFFLFLSDICDVYVCVSSRASRDINKINKFFLISRMLFYFYTIWLRFNKCASFLNF